MWIIRHQNGTMMGCSVNKPGDGNLLPDNTPEVHEFVDDDPSSPGYDAAGTAEIAAFHEAQQAALRARVDDARTEADRKAAVEELKRKITLGAPQSEVNAALIELLSKG